MPGFLRSFLSLFKLIRYDEVFLLQGTPLMGVAFAIGDFTAGKATTVFLFVAASFLLVAHIFAFNDWSESYAQKDSSNATANAGNEELIRRKLLLLSSFLLLGSVLIFAFLPRPTLVLAVFTAVIGIFYSYPLLNGKCIPILCSLLHFWGGLLHFLLGYMLFASLDRRGVLIALFFALTFMAGHLNHELIDFEIDRQNCLTTNAVTFGKRGVFLAGLTVFTVAYVWLFILASSEFIPRPLMLLPILLYPLHLFWSLRALRKGLDSNSVSRLQLRYRLLYAIMGLAMLTVLVGAWIPARS
jgi:lycopene elongase/hydratase (dihydrobisanhydrobacterioruberin-forming)